MFNLFSKKSFISKDDIEFQIETFSWLLKYFGGEAFYQESQLILPTDAYFPSHTESPQQAAQATFEQIKLYAGMQQWPCVLIEQEADLQTQVASTLMIQNVPNSPHGTFSSNNQQIEISYNPALLSNPAQLVATLTHELAHYLTATAPEPPPGGWDNWEFATDLTAVFLGFGIFQANCAFNFQQFSDMEAQGWSYQRSGYLSENELLFALAVFCQLKQLDPQLAFTYLKPKLKKRFKTALTVSSHNGLIEQLRKVEFIGQQ